MSPTPKVTQATRRHALVTGGAKGIGRAVALSLRSAGFAVSIIGRDSEALQMALGAGVADFAATADVTDERALSEAIASLATHAPFCVAVANAGGAELASFDRSDAALFQRMFELNTLGCIRVFQAVLPAMRQAGQGRLVAIASTAAHRGYAQASAYVAAKHAMLGVVKSLALELAGTGISVNAVSPGYTETDLVGRAVEAIAARRKISLAEARAIFERDNPAGRLIRPEEVAEAVRFLCEAPGDSLNGQSILINGGEF